MHSEWRDMAAYVARLESLVKLASEAIDVLALDSDEAGYPNRAEKATVFAMELRSALSSGERTEGGA